MKRGNPRKPTVTEFPKVQNGLSIPEFLRKYPNILGLWLKRPDNPPYYISPTFLCAWSTEGVRGRIKDRGKGRAIWKVATDLESLLEAIDAEMGLEWPSWRFDDSADQRAYTERKDRSTR